MIVLLSPDCSYLAAQSRSGPAKSEKKGLGFSILHDSDDSENRMSRLSEGRGNDWKEAPVEGVMSKEQGECKHTRKMERGTCKMLWR